MNMSKKPTLKKGQPKNISELTIDTGARIAKDIVKQDKGVIGQAMEFIDSPLGQKLVDIGLDFVRAQLMSMTNPNPKESSIMASGNLEGAVKPRSKYHEQLFRILNSIPGEQVAQIMPLVEKFLSPTGQKEIMEMFLNPAKLQETIKDLMEG